MIISIVFIAMSFPKLHLNNKIIFNQDIVMNNMCICLVA